MRRTRSTAAFLSRGITASRSTSSRSTPLSLSSRPAASGLVVTWALVARLEVAGAGVEGGDAGIALGTTPAAPTCLAASTRVRCLVDAGSSSATLSIAPPP